MNLSPLGRAALPLLLVLIVFSSGCTQTQSGSGVIIEEFGPDFSDILSGEPVQFQAKVRNSGSVDSQRVHMELLGLDEDWCLSTGGCINNEKLPDEEECKYTGKGFSLMAPDPLYGTLGDMHSCTWSYTAPPLPKGITNTYIPTARVFYVYKSTTIKSVTIGSQSEMRALVNSGKTVPASTVSTTNSPVSISVASKSPIRLWQGGSITFPIEITIKNTQKGAPCAQDEGASQDSHKKSCKYTTSLEAGKDLKNRVVLVIKMPSGLELSDECKDFKGEKGKVVPLFKGDYNTFNCDVTVTKVPETGVVQKNIELGAYYEYYYDLSSKITVTGV